MPDGFGINFISHIILINPQVIIVMISAQPAEALFEPAPQQGVHFFLTKPFSVQILNDILEQSQPLAR